MKYAIKFLQIYNKILHFIYKLILDSQNFFVQLKIIIILLLLLQLLLIFMFPYIIIKA